MEKVVYILGAGFSAPLGLPVMSNFVEKSKDQYFSDPENFAFFQDVFDAIDKLQKTKSYYETDLFNIEDILSILEFRTRFNVDGEHEQKRRQFLDYIASVITYFTPDQVFQENPDNLFVSPFWNPYIQFVASILNCRFRHKTRELANSFGKRSHIYAKPVYYNTYYSIVTLNYDLILETIQKHFEHLFCPIKFSRSINQIDENYKYLAKLHGSIDSDDIIPPTWNKGLHSNTLSDWSLAFKILSEANHIRVLGYSLPLTDTYIRYLLRATIVDTPHLKTIDVLCKDPKGLVKDSYDEFITFKNYRFLSADISDYFYANQKRSYEDGLLGFDLEQAHTTFFSNPDQFLNRGG